MSMGVKEQAIEFAKAAVAADEGGDHVVRALSSIVWLPLPGAVRLTRCADTPDNEPHMNYWSMGMGGEKCSRCTPPLTQTPRGGA